MDRCTTITGIKIAPVSAALIVTASLLLAACGGGGGGSTPNTPVVTPTVGPTSQPTTRGSAMPTTAPTTAAQAAAYVCPTTGTVASARTSGAAGSSRRMPGLAKGQIVSPNTLLAVTYARPTLTANLARVTAMEGTLGATLVRSYDYPTQSTAIRVVSVPTSQLTTTEASLRSITGVSSVGVTGQRRFHATVSGPYYTSDPYFTGEAPVKETPPYSESASSPGQWDMHAIGLDYAFEYSQNPNGSGVGNTNALGSSSIKIAIIDTGEDASQPELTSKIAYQKCFITNDGATPVVQSSGSFSTDEDGHGTDVSGIAAAATNNSLGFAGVGGNASIYAYRVFPTPDDNCANANSNDNQCSSSTSDIASAINDAVAQNVNVISLSLGGGNCSAGQDTDPIEGAAVTNALNHNIIVVAASGNAGGATATVDAPACITGVIAVGASALYDGTATGTTAFSRMGVLTSGTATSPVEYVPSYSQYGATNGYRNGQAWGIVAPGGDPSQSEGTTNVAADDLHWIENTWTSTPFMSTPSDTNFTGNCRPDYNGLTGLTTTADCRTLIAGTSMSTPHVAGAAALILAVNSAYQSPSAMKSLLCSTSDDLGGDTHQGCGRLNVYRAMATALHDPTLP